MDPTNFWTSVETQPNVTEYAFFLLYTKKKNQADKLNYSAYGIVHQSQKNIKISMYVSAWPKRQQIKS